MSFPVGLGREEKYRKLSCRFQGMFICPYETYKTSRQFPYGNNNLFHVKRGSTYNSILNQCTSCMTSTSLGISGTALEPNNPTQKKYRSNHRLHATVLSYSDSKEKSYRAFRMTTVTRKPSSLCSANTSPSIRCIRPRQMYRPSPLPFT